jgi:hypothetical protein
MSYQGYLAGTTYGEAPATPRVCNARGIPASTSTTAVTPNRMACAHVTGVADPGTVITAAVARAVEMLDNTIGELINARNAVCRGEPPAWPLIGDITADWLKNRLGVCIDDVRAWTAGTFVNRSVAEVIRRLTRVRNLIASNSIRYTCNDPGCAPDFWAFVMIDPTCATTNPTVIRLCSQFWARVEGVTPGDHAEFQAQTIIHEASHLYHCTIDPKPGSRVAGSGIGVAECLAQFVAATNGSPIDPNFAAVCATTHWCNAAAAAAHPAIHGFGAAPSSGLIKVATVFRPRNAIRLKGRPARRS